MQQQQQQQQQLQASVSMCAMHILQQSRFSFLVPATLLASNKEMQIGFDTQAAVVLNSCAAFCSPLPFPSPLAALRMA
jgi:hypothetical protein